MSEPVLEVIRRELRRVSPDVRIELEQIKNVFCNEVLKREVIDGEQADMARKKIARAASKTLRKVAKQEIKQQAERDPSVVPGSS
jgi:hypothetical protein